MIKSLLAWVLILLAATAYSQKHDNIWLFGFGGGSQTPTTDSFGITLLDFNKNNEPEIIENQIIDVNFNGTNASICDSSGNLLFYTNGEHVFSHDHQIMQNGNNIAEITSGGGYRLPQGAMILPFPKHTNQYILLTVEDHPGPAFGWKLFYHVIDMTFNSGKGKVIEKRNLLVQDSLSWGKIAATKHANGRDWWIVVPRDFSNKYYIGLLQPSGITIDTFANIETVFDGLGQATFSPNGAYYIRVDHVSALTPSQISIFNFDRCEGNLYNSRNYHLNLENSFGIGCAVSPDSKYLYINNTFEIIKYDLTAPDIFGTYEKVAEWDGQKYYIWPTDFYLGSVAPDGRIYINTSNGSTSMHRINFPNRPSTTCDIVQNAIHTPTLFQYEMPNFPNYRLGPIDESTCDSLGIDNHPVANFRWEQEDTNNILNITFTDLSAYEPDSWHWDFGDGFTSLVANPTHTYATNGTYNVCLIVSNENSADTLCRLVNIGISNINEHNRASFEVMVWPNPFTSYIFLDLKGLDCLTGKIDLYDITSHLIATKNWSGGQFEWGLENLPVGVYFYEVRTNSNFVKFGKIIKQ